MFKILLAIFLFFGMTCVLCSQTPLQRNVSVTTKNSSGTGIIVFQDMVLTVFHNLHVDSDIKVNGKVAKIIKVDPLHDLCLLGIKTPNGTTLIVFSKKFFPTEEVYCVGNPLDHKGVILVGRIFDFKNNLIYIDAHILMGMSGGGMYNDKEELLGIVVAVQGIKGIGYPYGIAISANTIISFLIED